MSMENVKKFLELVKTDEGLARKVVELKDSLQDGANLGSEVEILAEKVLPLAKAHGLEFTVEEFLEYSNSMSGELSDDDLLNVSGGISARGVALGLLFATGLSFVPSILSSFAEEPGGSAPAAPETSISQSYDAGGSLQREKDIDVNAGKNNQTSRELKAAKEKVDRLEAELKKKKRGKSTVSKGYMKNLQELEKARANVERLESIESEKNKKQFRKVMTELLEAKKDQQEDMGVALGDSDLEEKHEEGQDKIKDQVENKEEELEKNDEVVEEKKEEEERKLNEAKKNGQEKLKTLNNAINEAVGKGGDALNAAIGLQTELKQALEGDSAEAITQAANKVEEIVKTLNETVEKEKTGNGVVEEKKEDKKAVVDYDAAADYIGGFFDENDDQSNAGVNLGDNKMEEKHEERQDEIKEQVENKEKDEVVEEEQQEEEILEADRTKPQEVREVIEEVVDEEKDNIIEQQQEDEQSVEEKLVNEIQANGSIKWTGTMVFVNYKQLAVDMKNSGFFNLNDTQQKDIYQKAVRMVLSKQSAETAIIDSRLIAADDDIQQAKNTAVSKLIVGKGETEKSETGKITYDKLPRSSGIWKYKSCIDHIVNQVPGATEDISNFTLDKFDEDSQAQILKDISWLFSKKNADQIFDGDSSINKYALNKLAEIDAKYNYRSDQSSSWDKIMENINKGLENWDTLTADAKETLKKDIEYVCSKMGNANGTYYLGNMIPGSSSYGWNTKEPNEENKELELLVRLQNDGFSDVTATKEAHAQTTRYVSNQTGKLREKMERVIVGIKAWKDGKLLEASVDELKKDIEHLGGYIYTDKDKNPYLWALRDSYGYNSSSKRASGTVETTNAKVLQALKNANYDITNESVQEAIKDIN